MGVSLANKNADFYWNWLDWREVLLIAYDHGWRREGTIGSLYDEDEDYSDEEPRNLKGYFSNDGAFVTQQDAKNIAVALEKFVSKIIEDNKDNDPVCLDGTVCGHLMKFIEFCKMGGFVIL